MTDGDASFTQLVPGIPPAGVLLPPAALAELSGGVAVIDVSDAVDFEAGHVPGARNIPLFWDYRSLDEQGGLASMAERLREELRSEGIDGSKPAVFTEANPAAGFGRSSRALYMAARLGFPVSGLHVLDGGNLQWSRAGLPVETGPAAPASPVGFMAELQPDPGLFLTQAETVQALARGAKPLDVRNEPEFLGRCGAPYAVVEGDPPREIVLKPGRIPGAIGLLWTDVFETDGEGLGRFKSEEALLRLFASAGLSPGDEIVVYCFKGARACAVLLALHLSGFRAAKVYFSGWNEWAREGGLPRETRRPGASQLAGSYARDWRFGDQWNRKRL